MKDQPELQSGTLRRSDDEYRSQEESIAAIRSLTPEQYGRLVTMAAPLLPGTRRETRDLFHDVFVLIASGQRRWPTDVEFTAFVHGVMKSVAYNHRRKEARVELHPQGGGADDAANVIDLCRDDGPSPETRAVFADLERRAYAAVDGDEQAQWLLMGRLEGMSMKDFCKMHNISEKEFEAVSKRLQRGLQAHFAQGKRDV